MKFRKLFLFKNNEFILYKIKSYDKILQIIKRKVKNERRILRIIKKRKSRRNG